MDITEKAGKYAEGKAYEAMTNVIAQAYADGYRDGYKDCEEELPVDLRDNKTEYVDLGLPSGTLWSTAFEMLEGKRLFLPYEKAKRLNLPTEEQWEELQTKCIWTKENGKCYCTGPNGNTLYFPNTGLIEVNTIIDEEHWAYFWINNRKEDGNVLYCGFISMGFPIHATTGNRYRGFKLPIRLVR